MSIELPAAFRANAMFPITPTGKWGKERPVSFRVFSRTEEFVRVEVRSKDGAFMLNIPHAFIADCCRKP